MKKEIIIGGLIVVLAIIVMIIGVKTANKPNLNKAEATSKTAEVVVDAQGSIPYDWNYTIEDESIIKFNEQEKEKYFETVNKYLFCLTHNNDISEELTQETFYKAVKKIDTYKGECKMSVWLCQIAKNLWYDQCRKNKKFVDTKEVDLLNVQALNTLEEQVISNDEKISLYKKMQYLDEKTREVMYLRITGELSFKEIGIILNKTENWARVTFYRGKNQLKEVD